jgi:hypothetical protein
MEKWAQSKKEKEKKFKSRAKTSYKFVSLDKLCAHHIQHTQRV